ncbi:TlpA family protein disulfide reductase [Blastococcus litoris]|uniref:TlpA family protein disulfide reductase n=1 Tax=Blastococcus litoris TaxID=2171622 RepID=UPI001F12AB76|nr:TlpA disulfide reductase family protein [Blastococcus litoris]
MADIASRRLALVLCAAATAVSLAACGGEPGSNASTATESSGDFDFEGSTPLGKVIPIDARESAPAFEGELLDGTEFTSSNLAGDVTVLNFWGSWCAPCRIETPEFQAVYADVLDSGVRFLGVDVKDDRQMAQAFVDSVGVTYPSLFDPRGEVAMAFRGFPANVVPSTILIDRAGRVAAVYVAVVPEEDLRGALDQLAAEETPR